MVYADNVKDWNNLILTKAYLDLLNEDPEDVRHVFPHLPENAVADTLPVAAKGQPKYLIKYPGKSGSVTDAVSTVNPQDNDLCILRLSEVYLNAAEAAFKSAIRKSIDISECDSYPCQSGEIRNIC